MTLIAFNADVLIYAGVDNHALGSRVRDLFEGPGVTSVGIGSILLLTEVLAKPMRADPASEETATLLGLLSRLDLLPLDDATGRLALAMAVQYGLRAADAAHLATAVAGGAEFFLTNNRRDFPTSITEIDVIHPEDLPEPQMSPSTR